jgi:hypothetical protein
MEGLRGRLRATIGNGVVLGDKGRGDYGGTERGGGPH